MIYEGPIYRPPSEANSLLIQATVGCPHNKCTFCMVYKNGPKFRIRPVEEIKGDMDEAAVLGNRVKTLFFPAGNTIIMKTDDLVNICEYARVKFPNLERITVYGSSQYINKKSVDDLKRLAKAGLTRIHVGLESGDSVILERVKKGSTPEIHVEAGLKLKEAGIELSEYVVLGLGGKERTKEHVSETLAVLNKIDPDYVRLRTFMPKINTPMLEDVREGRFEVLTPHEVLDEIRRLIEGLDVTSIVASDHYTNYVYVDGKLPGDRELMLSVIEGALKNDESQFRPFIIGRE